MSGILSSREIIKSILEECTPEQYFERNIGGVCNVSHSHFRDPTNHVFKQITVKFSTDSEALKSHYNDLKYFFYDEVDVTSVNASKCKNFLLNHRHHSYNSEEGYIFVLEGYTFDCFKLMHDLRSTPAVLLKVAKQVLRCFCKVINLVSQKAAQEEMGKKFWIHFSLTSFKAICLNEGHIIKFDWTDPSFLPKDVDKIDYASYLNHEIRQLIRETLSAIEAGPGVQISSEKESFEKIQKPKPILSNSPTKSNINKTPTTDIEALGQLETFRSKLREIRKKEMASCEDLVTLLGDPAPKTLPSAYTEVALKRLISHRQHSTYTLDMGPEGRR